MDKGAAFYYQARFYPGGREGRGEKKKEGKKEEEKIKRHALLDSNNHHFDSFDSRTEREGDIAVRNKM